MNTATPSTPNGSTDPSATPHHRRSREEVEALAKNFIGTPVEVETAPVKRPPPRAVLAAGGAVVLIALAVVLWPEGRSDTERTQAESNRAAAAAEAEAYRQRFEAERERKRKELASGKEYLERMAAADAALMKDFGEQATRLAQRTAAAPASADAPPTPREPTRTASAPAKAASTPAQPAPAPSTPAKAAPAPAPATEQQAAKAEPAAPAQSPPQQVAQVDKSACSIHVSELSKSGKLTYEDVKRMKGSRLDTDSGNVFTPPVQVAGRNVVFEVMPTGCVRMVRR